MENNEINKDDILTNEDLLWPNKVDLTYVLLIGIWSTIAWFVWWIIILVFIFFFLWKMKSFEWAYPVIYSLTAFFSVWATSYLTLLMHQIIAWDKYRKWVTTFTQVSIFLIFLYIFMAPAYLYAASIRSNLLIYIFTIHIIISVLWTAIISELISNYRYVLIWLYGIFIWLFISVFMSIFIFINYETWHVTLYVLIWIIMLINISVNLFRAIFEYVYYMIYKLTWYDQIWDIFSKIEFEERELERQAIKKLEKF
jgi:hypothetical protein